MIINQPTFGFPQIDAENAVINESWNSNGVSNNIADSIGLMVYTPVSRSRIKPCSCHAILLLLTLQEADSLNWIDEYTESGSKWHGFPITADVPESAVIIGVKARENELAFISHYRTVLCLLSVVTYVHRAPTRLGCGPAWPTR